jgi:hypothetical protein
MRYKLSRTLALVAEEKRKNDSEIHTSSWSKWCIPRR